MLMALSARTFNQPRDTAWAFFDTELMLALSTSTAVRYSLVRAARLQEQGQVMRPQQRPESHPKNAALWTPWHHLRVGTNCI